MILTKGKNMPPCVVREETGLDQLFILGRMAKPIIFIQKKRPYPEKHVVRYVAINPGTSCRKPKDTGIRWFEPRQAGRGAFKYLSPGSDLLLKENLSSRT